MILSRKYLFPIISWYTTPFRSTSETLSRYFEHNIVLLVCITLTCFQLSNVFSPIPCVKSKICLSILIKDAHLSLSPNVRFESCFPWSQYILLSCLLSQYFTNCSKHSTPISWPSLSSYSFPGSCSLSHCRLHVAMIHSCSKFILWKEGVGRPLRSKEIETKRGDLWSWILFCLISSYGSSITLSLFFECAAKAIWFHLFSNGILRTS